MVQVSKVLQMSRRFRYLVFLLLLLLALQSNGYADSDTASFAGLLQQGVSAIEGGQIQDAQGLLQNAQSFRPNDPTVLLSLATLQIRMGNFERAAHLFSQVRGDFPEDSLATWGEGLSNLGRGAGDVTLFEGLSEQEIPAAPLLSLYMRLLYGNLPNRDASVLRRNQAQIRAVTADEPDPLRLEIAALTELKSGDATRGAVLLKALLARPVMTLLAEDNALTLPFQANLPMEAVTLPPALPQNTAQILGSPNTKSTEFSNRVVLTPENGLTAGVHFVTYRVEGSGFVASTNYSPFAVSWDTTRVANGTYILRTTCFGDGKKILRESKRTITVANGENRYRSSRVAPLSESELQGIRARLLNLLTPHLSRKAAYFALAQWAVAQGNSNLALVAIEAVVAIDPTFQNAQASLRQYNHELLGPREGIWRATTTDKVVALTFDDGPNPLPGHTPALLDALRAAKIAATFFVVGARAEQATALLRRMSHEGHEIANHSYSHPNLTRITTADVERELCRTSVIIRSATGKRPRFFRPPGGNFNTGVIAAAESLGMAGAYWTVDALPFESSPHTPDQLTHYVLSNLRPGAIILMHNAPANTIAALPAIVRGLRARGYTILTMSELVRHHQVSVAKK